MGNSQSEPKPTPEENMSKTINFPQNKPTKLTTIKNLLIVDDVTVLGDIFIQYMELEEYNTNVTHAISGLIALEKCKELNPEVIIMDIKMIPIDGFETTKRLRKAGYAGYIMGFSGMVDFASRQIAAESGMNVLESKPCEIDLIIKKLEKAGYVFK